MWLGEVRRSVHTLLPSPFLSLSFVLPSSLHPSLLSPLPCSLLRSRSGRAVPEGPGEHVVAAPEASGTGSFHSESGVLSGAEGRAGQPPTGWPLAGFGEERPWGLLPPLLAAPHPWGITDFHGSFLPKPLMCLDVSWRKHGGARAVPADRCAPGEGGARGCQASVLLRVEAGGLHGPRPGCFLALQECALRAGTHWMPARFRELRLPRRQARCLRNQRPPC